MQIGLPFALVVYLALRDGGFEQTVWGGAGIAIWWLIALGAVIGLWPARGVNRGAAVAFGLLAAFTLWTGLALLWTDSAERTTIEAARACSYLGVLGLSLLSGVAGAPRRVAAGIGAGVIVVAVLAALSRFEPDLFPESEIPDFLPAAAARLSYPLNYWNGLAALLAIGAPLALHMAASTRRPAYAAIWAAALPVIILSAYMTLSRGGALEAAIAIAVYVGLRARRLEAAPFLVLAALPGAALIWLLERRSELAEGLTTGVAESQGHEMLAITLGLAAVTGLAAHRLVAMREAGAVKIPTVSRQSARRGAIVLGVAAVIALGAVAATGEIADRWESFKSPEIADNTTSGRLGSASGNGRYQYWDSSLEANATAPLTGVGPGTWEFWWAENGTITGFVRDAHGVYFEVLAEAGIIGLALLAGFLVWVGVIGVGRAISAQPEQRSDQAAILAAGAAFLVAAGIDWVWEQPILPATFMLIVAVIVGPAFGQRRTAVGGSALPASTSARGRVVIGVCAAILAAALVMPYLTAERIATSQGRAAVGDLQGAFDAALDAQSLEPFAASPRLQEALVLERSGLFDEALEPAMEATEREPTNWRTWFVLSRIESQAGLSVEAARHFEQARSLNPRSPLFAAPG